MEANAEETRSIKPKATGGYTHGVLGCYLNSKRDNSLSFYKTPQDKTLRRKWINAISFHKSSSIENDLRAVFTTR